MMMRHAGHGRLPLRKSGSEAESQQKGQAAME